MNRPASVETTNRTSAGSGAAAYSEGFLAAAALPALVLFVVSTLAGLFIVRA